jgi:hypothetical protein
VKALDPNAPSIGNVSRFEQDAAQRDEFARALRTPATSLTPLQFSFVARTQLPKCSEKRRDSRFNPPI